LRQAAGGADVLLTRPHGYLLQVDPGNVDAERFEARRIRSRQCADAGDHAAAADTLREALAEWRGPALADVLDVPFVRAQAVRLEETRLAAVEQRVDHDLACGRHAELIGELEHLTTLHPLRERLWGALVLALYRSGRQADALAAYQGLRSLLQNDLGLEPSSPLTQLHGAVLRHDPTLDWSPTPPTSAARSSVAAPAAGPPPTRYAKNEGVNIAYQVIGRGPPDVVLVPGFVSHLDLAWENAGWRRIFERLAARCRLILWDKRGTGLSDPVHRVPTLDERVEDLLAVLDAAGSEQATLLGISEGGPMSLLFAGSHPRRARSLVLYGVSPRFSQGPDWPWGWTQPEIAAILTELEEAWGQGALLDLFAPGVAGDETARHNWGRTQRAGASPAMARAVMEAMVAFDCRDLLPAIRIPTLVLHRRGDRVARVEGARHLAAHIPGARLVEFTGDNHLITAGEVAPILDQVESFLAGTVPEAECDQVLATVLTVDHVTSTGTAPSGSGDRGQVDDHFRSVVRREFARFGGHELASSGPALVATFLSPSRSLACAAAIRQAVVPSGFAVRAGVHTGECDVVGDHVNGLPVRVSGDLTALAAPGQLLVTSTVKELMTGTQLTLTPSGSHRLGGTTDACAVYAVDE
jgi:pimeloyl-ACP methyl ester carboxylesterase